jgi:hypothetical protein
MLEKTRKGGNLSVHDQECAKSGASGRDTALIRRGNFSENGL